MFLRQLLNLLTSRFILRHIDLGQEVLTVLLESRCKRCLCPVCHRFSDHIHSRYQRHLKDLPCFAYKTLIHLTVHKFYYRNPLCPQKVFTERFAAGIDRYQRMTDRLTALLSSLTLQLSGRGAERLCALLHIEVSDTTLGRLLHKQPLQEPLTPKVLGVDDWALKKRNRYGTILVDLEQHKIVDLLADRETKTLQKWLEEHPGVEIVSRDRYTNYSNAITAALPRCTQVADRWHLLKNLGADLKKLVERNHQHIKYARKKEIKRLRKQSHFRWLRKQKEVSSKLTENYARRWQQFQEIKKLQVKGVPILAMARTLGMSRNTVKKYLHLQEPPRRKSFLQVNIAAFDAYIRRRIKQEPDVQLMKLFREIKERGYNGGRISAFVHLHEYINRASGFKPPRLPDIFYVPSKISFLLLRKPEQLNSKEQTLATDLCK
jgi:transposase